MPVILVQIDASDNASSGINRVAGNLNTLDQAMARMAGSGTAVQRALDQQARSYQSLDSASARLQASITQQEAATLRAARATDTYRAAQDALVGATDNVGAAQDRAARAFGTMITAQERAALANQKMADSYRAVATAEDNAARSRQRTQDQLNAPPKESSGGGNRLGGFARSALAGAGYAAAYGIYSGASAAFQGANTFDQAMGLLSSSTDLKNDPQGLAALRSYATTLGGSGTQPYSQTTIAQGLLSIASAGVSDVGAIRGINQAGLMGSVASGATDTATMNNTLVKTMIAMGIDPSQMGKRAMGVEDLIMQSVNKGVVDPTQVPQAVSHFTGRAAQSGLGVASAMGLFAMDTQTSGSPDQSGVNVQDFIKAVTNPNKMQQKFIRDLGAQNLFGSDTFQHMDINTWLKDFQQITRLSPAFDTQKLFSGNANAQSLVMNAIGPGGKNLAQTTGIVSSFGQENVTGSAFNAMEGTQSAQLANATAKFSTASERFADAAMPFATALLTKGADIITALEKFANPAHPGDSARTLNDALGTKNLPGFMQAGGNLVDRAMQTIGLGENIAPAFSSPFGPGTAHAEASSLVHTPAGTYSASWYAAMGIPLGGANAVGHAPGTAPQAISVDYQNDVTRRAYASRTRLATGQSGHGMGGIADADLAARQAALNADAGLSPRGGGPVDILGIARSAYFTAQGQGIDYARQQATAQAGRRDSLLGAASGAYFSNQAAGIDYAAKQAQAMKLEGDQLALTAAQQNLDAARMMGATPDALGRVNHEYLAAQRQLAKDTLSGPALTSALRGLDKQQAGGDYQTQQADLQRRERDLQNRVQMDQLSGNAGAQARDQKALTAFMRANAGMLGLDASDLALQSAQDKAALLARTTPNPAPFRANQAGFGAFGGGEGTVSVRVGGGTDPLLEELRKLREENASLRSIDRHLQELVNQGKGRPQAAQGSLLSHTGSNHGYKG